MTKMGFGRVTDLAVVTNIAPTATSEQLRTLLTIGTIREFVVYPTNDPSQTVTRVCYVRYQDPINVSVAEHLTNTVFIDRAIMVKPVSDGRIPDETQAIKLANEGHSQNSSNSGVVSQVANVNGTQSITTIDPRLNALGLPQYPPLPANLDPAKIEEIRRTVSATNISQYSTPEQILEFFNQFGEVKYLRMTSNETDLIKSALIEFTDQSSVANALQSTGINLNGSLIGISHSSSGILKPHHNINHGNGIDNIKAQDPKPRSKDSPVSASRRSRSQSRRSRSPHRSKRRSITPSPPRERRRRSRSRERRRSIDRKRSPSPVYGKDRDRRDRVEKIRDRDSRRDRERERSRRSVERSRDRDRERSRERRDRERSRRGHSRERKSKDLDRERSRRKERSRDSERKVVEKSRRRDNYRRPSHSRSRSTSVKRSITDFPEERKSIDIDDDKKMELDSMSAKSDEGGSPLRKSSTTWLTASSL